MNIKTVLLKQVFGKSVNLVIRTAGLSLRLWRTDSGQIGLQRFGG